MGSLKEGLTAKIESSQETGREITNLAEQEGTDASASAEIISSLECIDDDDREHAENARNEGRSISIQKANEIRQQTAEVVNGLSETGNQAQDYANVEHGDAGKASGMVGDYSGIGSSLASSFEASAAAFEGIASNANDVASQLESTNDALAAAIEGAF